MESWKSKVAVTLRLRGSGAPVTPFIRFSSLWRLNRDIWCVFLPVGFVSYVELLLSGPVREVAQSDEKSAEPCGGLYGVEIR